MRHYPEAMQSKNEFTGLILISGPESADLLANLFDVLAPFSIAILDVEHFVTRSRLICTVLISLNKDHCSAIEADLLAFANDKSVDLAIDFSEVPQDVLHPAPYLAEISLTSSKLLPADLALFFALIHKSLGTIVNVRRTQVGTSLTVHASVAFSTDPDLAQFPNLSIANAQINAVKI